MKMPKSISHSPLLVAVLFTVGLLSACGQKGDLYVPDTTSNVHKNDRFLLDRSLLTLPTTSQAETNPPQTSPDGLDDADTAKQHVLEDDSAQAF